MKPLLVQLVPVAPRPLPVAPCEERASVLFVAIHIPVRFDRGLCDRCPVLAAFTEPAATSTAEGFNVRLSYVLFNAICPGTFFSCTMKRLYFVIRSISTLEYRFTARHYRVSSKSEKRKERSYITGPALQSPPATARIASQGFPPSKTSPFFPKSAPASPSKAARAFNLKSRDHPYSCGAPHPTLKGKLEG